MIKKVKKKEKRKFKFEILSNILFIYLLGFCSYINPTFSSITGFTLENSQTRSWLEFIHPDDKKMVREQFSNFQKIENN